MRDSAREVAQIVDRGVERYGLGDVAGAAQAFREALQLQPDDLRVRSYLEWVEFRMRAEQRPAPVDKDEDSQALVQALAMMDPDPGPGATAPGSGRARAEEDDVTHERRAWPSLADVSENERTTARRMRSSDEGDGEPTLVRTGADDEDPTAVYRLGQPWNEPTPIGARELRDAEVEREFISKVSTHPNLPPLDVPELTDEAVESLAKEAGVELPSQAQPAAPAVVEIVAEPESDGEKAREPSGEVTIEIEVEEPESDDDPRATQRRASPESSDAGATIRRPVTPIGAKPGPRPIGPLVQAAREAVERGDFAGAYDAAETLVASVGGIDAPELIAHASLLGQIYEQQLGDLERIAVVARVPERLDPRAAFLLSRVDGLLTLEDLHDVSGMPWLEAIRLLAVMLKQGALAVR